MANETEHANFITVAAYVDATIAPHLRAKSIMMNLCAMKNFQSRSDSFKLVKAGSLTATTATESTDHAVSEYTETSPNTLTAAEVKVYTEISDKAIGFANASPDAIAEEAARAIAQKFDTDAMALFDAFSGGTAVGVSGVDCSPLILLEANYTLNAANIDGPFVYVLHPIQIRDVQEDILASAASLWANPAQLGILNGMTPAANGYRGRFLDSDVYQSTNTESVNTDADWAGALFSPRFALAAAVHGGTTTKLGYNVKKGVTEIGVSLWYDIKEWEDKAGVSIETDK